MKDRILIKRGVLEISGESSQDAAAYSAKLFNQFGIVVDRPKYLSAANLQTVSAFYGTAIPEGFYKNPQHLQYFSADELLVEQLISYFTVEICGERSLNAETFTRKTVFNKALPDYEEGKEVKIRFYRMLTAAQCDNMLSDVAADLCRYTRKWSADESAEFKWLYLNGYYGDDALKCKDNAIEMFLEYKNKSFAKMLDKKDIVKMSVDKFGERKTLDFSDDDKTLFALAAECARDCPLTKKQAKYYNSVVKNAGIRAPKENNNASAYKRALKLLKSGDVLGAAQVFAASGSLLERNIVFLLSRCNACQAQAVADMLKAGNPIVLIQLLYGINADDGKSKRTFSFVNNRLYKSHEETDFEFACRKSVLSSEIREILKRTLYGKIRECYSNMPTLGNIYISEAFRRVALPLNTSASGSGLDVLPSGSRLPIRGEYLRTFCYWNKAFDIDASVIFLKENGENACLFWGNYSEKQFGNSVLCSGDDRSATGAEFCDFRISEVSDLGYKYAVFTLNGFGSTLDEGEIYCGYQDKSNLDTDVWSAKNIELKIHVKGKTRNYVGFAFDLQRRETVVLNRLLDGESRVVNSGMIKAVKAFLTDGYLETFNAYDLLVMRGNAVDRPEDADVVFDADYLPSAEQKVIRPYDTEKLVNLLK